MTDEFEEIDREFSRAAGVVRDCLRLNAPMTDQVDEAADRMFDIAIQLADPSMLRECVNACFNCFIEQKRTPPTAALEHTKDAFARWHRNEAPSLDAAFGMAQDGPGRKSRWAERAIKRLYDGWVDICRMQGSSIERGIEEAEFITAWLRDGTWDNSIDKYLERTYTKHRRKVKGGNSE